MRRIYWTYDPLVGRNAPLNLVKLGAEMVEYVVDMYGDTDSELHRMGTDRFIVRWCLRDHGGSGPRSPVAADAVEGAPILDVGGADGGVRDITARVVQRGATQCEEES